MLYRSPLFFFLFEKRAPHFSQNSTTTKHDACTPPLFLPFDDMIALTTGIYLNDTGGRSVRTASGILGCLTEAEATKTLASSKSIKRHFCPCASATMQNYDAIVRLHATVTIAFV